jgi:hypothetical protein
MPTNDEIKKELLFNFQNGYTASTGKPLQVDNRSLKDDPFLDAFIAVGSILSNKEEVISGLAKLETAMTLTYKLSNKSTIPEYTKKSPTEQVKDLANYYSTQNGSGKTTKDEGMKGLLSRALGEVEQAHKINGGVATLFGNIQPEAFVNQLLKKRRPFKDPGPGGTHGEYTHRIQWFIVCTSKYFQSYTAGDVYEQVGKWFFSNVKNKDKQKEKQGENLSMWDALVDRYGGTTNQFPNDAALETMDFRNPNNLHPWMQGNTDDQSNKFPILNAYLKARELKRTEEPMTADYVSKKLYGIEYKTLLQQERDNLNGRAPTAKTMPRVFAIAQHLAGGHGKANVIIDSEVIRPDAIPGYGIVDRSDFHKNRWWVRAKTRFTSWQ